MNVNLKDLYLMLKKRLSTIIIVTIIFTIVSGLVSFYVLEEKYESDSTIAVGELDLAHTYVSLLEGKDIYDELVNDLDLDMEFGEFKRNLNIDLISNSEIIQIQVINTSPDMAASIANQVTSIFMDRSQEFLETRVQIVDGVKVEREPISPRLINQAEVPKRPVGPRPILNIGVGGITGLMFGILGALVLEYINQTVKSEDDIEKHIELPVVAGILKSGDSEEEMLISHNPKSRSPLVESYRNLKTNISYGPDGRKVKSISITSAIGNEGKSVIASNLAITMARENKKVLLIDGDLRRPKIHDRFKLDNLQGLTNVLNKDKPLEEVIQTYEKNDNLKILTSGSRLGNPTGVLDSKEMASFLESIEEDFDYIILYTPPVGILADSVVLSSLVDGVLLVTALDQANISEIKESKKLLEKSNSNIIGAVVNKIPTRANKFSRRYHEYYEKD